MTMTLFLNSRQHFEMRIAFPLAIPCADPESFAAVVPNLITFFFLLFKLMMG